MLPEYLIVHHIVSKVSKERVLYNSTKCQYTVLIFSIVRCSICTYTSVQFTFNFIYYMLFN